MSHRTLLACALTGAAILGVTPRADACSPPLPGVTDTIPKEGQTYPRNAAIFLFGHQIVLDQFTVTVDGELATLKEADIDAPSGLSASVFPPPAAGQTVVISGKFCEASSECPPVNLTFTAGPDDTEAPPPVAISRFDVFDHANFKAVPGSCRVDSDLAIWVDLETPGPVDGESPRFYTLEAYRDAALQDLAFTQSGFLTSANPSIELRLGASQLADAPAPEAFCFTVRVGDAAGNPAAVAPTAACKPCNYRVDETPTSGDVPPPEPIWTAEDLYPGGSCDGGSTTAGAGGSAGGSGGSESAGGSDGAGGSDNESGSDSSGGAAGDGGVNGGGSDGGGCSVSAAAGGSSMPGLLLAGATAALAAMRRSARSRHSSDKRAQSG